MTTLYIIRGLPGSGKTTLADAHRWCFEQTCAAIDAQIDVIVSNTFTQKWEAQRYIDYAEARNCAVSIIACSGPWKSKHDVPAHVLDKMRKRWEQF